MCVVLLLVLLCCSLLEEQLVSGNGFTNSLPEGKGDVPSGKWTEYTKAEAAAATFTPQSCPTDIHLVLREMSAMLAVLKVEQSHTTTLVNNIESKLRAGESLVEELKRTVQDLGTSFKNQVENLKKENQDLKTLFNSQVENLKKENQDLKTLFNSQVENLKKENQDLKTLFNSQVENLKKENQVRDLNLSYTEARFRTELESFKLKSNEELKNLNISFRATGDQVENLKKEGQKRQVSFSASLYGGKDGNTGPYPAEFPLIYKNVFTNIGNAYNPVTGVFTAPVRGVYKFEFYIHSAGGTYTSVALQKNGHHVAGAHAAQPQGKVSASNGVSLLLEVGDVVCLKLHSNTWLFDNWYLHNTFSGHMLFPL